MARTQIRVECEDCGVVRVAMPDLTIRMCVDDGSWSYCYRCPQCRTANARGSDGGALSMLVALGLPVQQWHYPAELAERRARNFGPPIGLDDVLDLHFLLEKPDWFATLAGHDRGVGPEGTRTTL